MSIIARYATPKIVAALATLLVASAVFGSIYLKGRADAAHKAEIASLELTVKALQSVIAEQERRLTEYEIVNDENQIALEIDRKRLAELESEKEDVIKSVPVDSGGIGRDATERLRTFWRNSDPDSHKD